MLKRTGSLAKHLMTFNDWRDLSHQANESAAQAVSSSIPLESCNIIGRMQVVY